MSFLISESQRNESIRKLIHFSFGLFFIIISFYITPLTITLISLTLTCWAILDQFFIKKIKFLYRKNSNSFGTILYPFAVSVLATLWLPNFQIIYIFALSILAFSDTLAAVVGQFQKNKIAFFKKTILGSTVFFVTTILISLLLFQKIEIIPIILSSLILTVIEFIFIYGFDNIALVLAASYLFYYFNF